MNIMIKNKSASFSFYSKLPVLTTFESVPDSVNYHPVPEDWHIVITDVIDSTGAIESGRDKEVNTAGCLAAMAISNITTDMDFPFLFDGDGMKYLIPQDLCSDVEEILLDTRRMVRDSSMQRASSRPDRLQTSRMYSGMSWTG